MKLLYSLLFCSLIFSFINTTPKEHEQRTTSLNKKIDKVLEKDSSEYWVSTDYLSSLDSVTSICDCWRNNKFHFLRYDTVKMELFLKSNLLHYGHDSEFTLPLIKTKNGFQYDSTVNDWKAPFREITILSNDSEDFPKNGTT